MRVAVACDHAGFPLKAPVRRALEADGHEVVDLGTYSTDPVDYPDYARAVGVAVRGGLVEAGILLCGSGAGVSIAANKIRGIRAALCHDLFTARQSREDDDANVLCLGARVVSEQQAVELARTFLAARFSHLPRHERRVAKIRELEAHPPTMSADPLALPPVADTVARLEGLRAVERLWKRDGSLWSEDPAVRSAVSRRLGWLSAPTAMRAHAADLARFAADVRDEGTLDVVLLGMGGSSLAAQVFADTFGSAPGMPRLTVLDTTDPGVIAATLARLDLPRTLFLVSSKSGTTAEMLALYRLFRAETEGAMARARPSPGATAGARFVAITDAGTPLERLAVEGAFRRTFLNDPEVGGRFSALTYFGLVPAALIGIDVERLLERAATMAEACGPRVAARDNPALRLGAVLGGLATAGRDKVTLVLSEPIRSLGAWLEQLLTESTGKQGRGLVVVDGEPLGPPDVYGTDRVFVAATLAADHTLDRPLADLEAAGHPVVRVVLGDRLDLGAEFFRWEVATATAGIVLRVNPFDEPNVAQAKEATQAALARYRESGRLPDWPIDTAADVARTIAQAKPGDYIALLAYLTPFPETAAALQELRVFLRDHARLATTVGYGPRYLHSTGQLHKGGPPTPILLLFARSDGEGLAIPGERHGFGILQMAQAQGDLATLRGAHRRAFWLPLAGPPAAAVRDFTSALRHLLAGS